MKNQIKKDIKEKRKEEIMSLQADISYQLNKELIGKRYRGLIIGKDNNEYLVRTSFNSPDDIDGNIYLQTDRVYNTGDIVNIDTKEVIGKHIGLMYYTIGQRRGLDIGGTKDRMFVVGKDLAKNILYICIGEDNDYLISDSCIIEDVN